MAQSSSQILTSFGKFASQSRYIRTHSYIKPHVGAFYHHPYSSLSTIFVPPLCSLHQTILSEDEFNEYVHFARRRRLLLRAHAARQRPSASTFANDKRWLSDRSRDSLRALLCPASDNNPIEDPSLNLLKHEEQSQTAQNNHQRKHTRKQTI